jgi:NCS1 family nucleobase:cation symporter-1
MVVNGRPGSKWHLSFPVAIRSCFGVYGAAWGTLNRAFMSCLWQYVISHFFFRRNFLRLFPYLLRSFSFSVSRGINAVSGGQCLYIMLFAMFPSIKNIPNIMSSKSGLDSAQMLCFFLFTGLVGGLAMLDMCVLPFSQH